MADTPKKLSADCVLIAGEAIDEKGILIAMLPADSEAYKGADVATQVIVGINEDVADEGDEIVAKSGIFLLENSSTQPVTKAQIGSSCYVEDEKTVALQAGPTNDVVAGTVVDVVDEGVFVKVGV